MATKIDLRELRKAITKVGDLAARSQWEAAIEVVTDSLKAHRRLELEPTSAGAIEIKQLLEIIPHKLTKDNRGAAWICAVAELAATEAHLVAKTLGDVEGAAAYEAEDAWTQLVSWKDLAGKVAPPREWLVPDWIPAHCVTLLHGYGGVGKSLLAQQIGTAAAFKRTILGGIADGCPVLGWYGEDDYNEIWRRQEAINSELGISNLDELDGKVHWRPCPGSDITLFKAANEGDFATTANFNVLREQIGDTKSQLVILDSVAQIAALSEVSRPLVTRCLSTLTGLCLSLKTTVLLIGHNNRNGDFSGSSAWENRARSRLHLKRDKAEDGTESIRIYRPKANYAETKLYDGVEVQWSAGAFKFVGAKFETAADRVERKHLEYETDMAFLDALDRLTKQRRATSASKRAGSSYAPRMMVNNGLMNGYSVKQLEASMERLMNERIIINDAQLWQKPDRHWAFGVGRIQPEPPADDPVSQNDWPAEGSS